MPTSTTTILIRQAFPVRTSERGTGQNRAADAFLVYSEGVTKGGEPEDEEVEPWHTMPDDLRAKFIVLGWDKSMWTLGESHPIAYDTPWDELSRTMQVAAGELGHTAVLWDEELEQAHEDEKQESRRRSLDDGRGYVLQERV